MTAARVGILLGRLSPAPPERPQVFPADWRGEMARAAAAGFEEMQWLYDAADAGNPLESETGRRDLRGLAARTGVAVTSVCAHAFVDVALLSPEGLLLLHRLVQWLGDTGGGDIVVPLFDASEPGDLDALATAIRPAAALALEERVTLLLESDLQPVRFAALLHRCAHPAVAANFDMGNSVAAMQDPRLAVAALAPWIRGVHVKDRRRGGASVPLGSGDLDLPLVMGLLAQAGYRGSFVLETARRPGQEVEAAVDAAVRVRAAWRAAHVAPPRREELASR